MEVFVDFGLFELVAALGLAALSRTIYSRKLAGLLFLVVSIAAPTALVIFASSSTQRWLAVVCLASALINSAVVAAVLQSGEIPSLQFPAMRSRRGTAKSGDKSMSPP